MTAYKELCNEKIDALKTKQQQREQRHSYDKRQQQDWD